MNTCHLKGTSLNFLKYHLITPILHSIGYPQKIGKSILYNERCSSWSRFKNNTTKHYYSKTHSSIQGELSITFISVDNISSLLTLALEKGTYSNDENSCLEAKKYRQAFPLLVNLLSENNIDPNS